MEKDDNLEQWERILTPQILRSNLATASLYIVAFETLKACIVNRIRDFFWMGWKEGEDIIDPTYEVDVLSKNKSVLYASLTWLKENDAITDDDIAIFERVKECRNQLAHEMITFLANGISEDFAQRFVEVLLLLNKIEKWWIIYFEIPINSQFDGKEIDEDGIIPGSVSQLKMMMDIALGTDEQAEYYIKGFIEKGIIKPNRES